MTSASPATSSPHVTDDVSFFLALMYGSVCLQFVCSQHQLTKPLETFGSFQEPISRDFKNMTHHLRQRDYTGPLQWSGHPDGPDDTESIRRAFDRMQQENQDLHNTIKQMQEEKSQLEEKNSELEAQNKYLGEICKQDQAVKDLQCQPNVEIINEGWKILLSKSQERSIDSMEAKQENNTELREMHNNFQDLQERYNELQYQHSNLEEIYNEKKYDFQQLEAKYKKTLYSYEDLQEIHKDTQFKLQESVEKNESLQVKFHQALEAKKQEEERQREMQDVLQDFERRNIELQVFYYEVKEENFRIEAEKVKLEKLCSQMQCNVQKMVEKNKQHEKRHKDMQHAVQKLQMKNQELHKMHYNVEQCNKDMHEAMKVQEEKYEDLKEKHAEKQKKLEEVEEQCKKLEEEAVENICAIKNLILQHKDLQERWLKKEQKRFRFFRKKSSAPAVQPGQNEPTRPSPFFRLLQLFT